MGLSCQTSMSDFLLMWDRDDSATYTNIYCIHTHTHTHTLLYYHLERQENDSSFYCILLNWSFLAIYSFSLVPTVNVSPYQIVTWSDDIQPEHYNLRNTHIDTDWHHKKIRTSLYFNNTNCTCHNPRTLDTKMFPVRCTYDIALRKAALGEKAKNLSK